MLKGFVYPFVSLFSVSQFACTYIYIYFELMDLRWNASAYEKKLNVFLYCCLNVDLVIYAEVCWFMALRVLWMCVLFEWNVCMHSRQKTTNRLVQFKMGVTAPLHTLTYSFCIWIVCAACVVYVVHTTRYTQYVFTIFQLFK